MTYKKPEKINEEKLHLQGNAKTDYIITIGRSYGAGGRSVGRALAKELNIPYYDKEIIEETALQSGLNAEHVEKKDEKTAKNIDSVEENVVMDKMIYRAQRETILGMAKKNLASLLEDVLIVF